MLEFVRAEKFNGRLRQVEVTLLAGAPGSAKTSGLIELLRTEVKGPPVGQYKFLAPRTFLRDDIADKLDLGPHGWIIQTLEKGLLLNPTRLTIIDEITLCHRGYPELLTYWSGLTNHVVLLGDPCQADHHEISSEARVNRIPGAMEPFLTAPFDYRGWTYRVAPGVSRLFGLPSFSKRQAGVLFRSDARLALPTICPNTQNAQHSAGNTFTYGTSQGQDFQGDWQVIITQDTLQACSLESIYVACTRGKGNLIIITRFIWTGTTINLVRNNPILNAIYFDVPCDYRQVFADKLRNARFLPLPHAPVQPGPRRRFDLPGLTPARRAKLFGDEPTGTLTPRA